MEEDRIIRGSNTNLYIRYHTYPLSQSLKMCHSKDDLVHVFLPGGVTGRKIILISF